MDSTDPLGRIEDLLFKAVNRLEQELDILDAPFRELLDDTQDYVLSALEEVMELRRQERVARQGDQSTHREDVAA